jgi:isopentenyl-diphosphate Delta-isomerase
MDYVVLVDEQDNAIGTMEKMEAHRKGVLHRAFSVVVFNTKGEMLLQKRAGSKYHSAGLWTNACCSHPAPGEKIEDAARRRLREEMGMDVEPKFNYKFIYKTDLEGGLIEHELDHVLLGYCNDEPHINKDEVEDWKYVNINWLRRDVLLHPDSYTYWFRMIMDYTSNAIPS